MSEWQMARFKFLLDEMGLYSQCLPSLPDTLNAAHDEIVELFAENLILKKKILELEKTNEVHWTESIGGQCS